MFKKLNVVSETRIAVLVCTLALLSSCNRSASPPEKTYPADSTVEVGGLSFSVSGQQWLSSIDGERGPRVPTNKFLVLTLSVTNKKGDQATIPLLTLIDGSGQNYLELDNGEGLPNWLGLFRNIQPNGTEGGSVLFDVPSGKGPYKVRVSGGGDVEKEVTALVEVRDEKATQSSAPMAPDPGQ